MFYYAMTYIIMMSEIESEEEAAEEFRVQLENVFFETLFPVNDPFELIPLLPDGKDTVFNIGNVTISAKDIGMKYNDYQEFPYESRDELIDDIIRSVREHGDLYREEKEYEHSITIEFWAQC